MATEVRNICSLDYLVGTIATAYKGVITSLVVKDFCVLEAAETTTVKGTIVAMPAGDYEARLLRNGVILSRTALDHGFFELKVPNREAESLADLQIDVVQAGKHIGSFLLKRESRDKAYISAFELSEELKGMDLKQLTLFVREKPGLLQKAEEILSIIVSPKKDWQAFSEKLNTFTLDIFWAQRAAFYTSFPILARFLRVCADRIDASLTNKPISNFLAILELPLEQEENNERLRTVVSLWLRECEMSRMDPVPLLRRFVNVFRMIVEKFSAQRLEPVLEKVLTSLRKKIENAPLLTEGLVESVAKISDARDLDSLRVYSDAGRKQLREHVSEIENSVQDGNMQKAIALLSTLDIELLHDEKMIAAFFDLLNKELREDTALSLLSSAHNVFGLSPRLSRKARERLMTSVPMLMQKFVHFKTKDAAFSLLEVIQKIEPAFREEILLNSTMAAAIASSGSSALIHQYALLLSEILIPAAKLHGHAPESWADIVDPRHLERLSRFMDILQVGKGKYHDVLIHVVANLYLSGVFIPDDKLFQRKLSSYLNSSAMQTDTLLNYLFLKKMPVYFNELGATSSIRDYSTEIDSWSNDPTLYFLRKQVHVNASNRNIELIEKIIAAWVHGDPALLEKSLPTEIFAGLRPELLKEYTNAIRPFFEKLGVLDSTGLHLERLLSRPASAFSSAGANENESFSKVIIICNLYRELVKKYSFASSGSATTDVYSELSAQVEKMKTLDATIHAPVKTEPEESLFFKRHIAFGIPSVLGSYHEKKFDAMGETFRTESRIEVLLESVIHEVSEKTESFSTADLLKWLGALTAGYEVLALRGFKNLQIDELVTILQHRPLKISQVADLLRMWQKEFRWFVETLTRIFSKPLAAMLPLYVAQDLPDTLMNLDVQDKDFVHKAGDIILRDMMNDVPALVASDRLVEQLLNALEGMLKAGADDLLRTTPREESGFYLLDELSDHEAMALAPDIGGKAKNLVYLHNRRFHIPFGLVLPARHTQTYNDFTDSEEFKAILRQAVKCLEEKTDLVFGANERPLFLSVRSGAYISMPGILSSILYCGMNSRTVEAFSRETGDPWLAWDSYRRFLEHYGTIVLGLDFKIFDTIMKHVMAEQRVASKDALRESDNRQVVGLYHQAFAKRELSVPEDVYEQLRLSIRAVYASWFSPRAMQFKKASHASEEWGTAVAVMQMISGNRKGSGASVFFTRDPFTYEQGIFGETRENGSGDDLVSGRQTNRPLTRKQEQGPSLEDQDPELFELHRDLATRIEHAMGDLPQEVEATYVRDNGGKRSIYVLQTRRMEFGTSFTERFNEICRMESHIIARGVGAHGGAVSGVASFASSPEEAAQLQKDSGMPLILLRESANTEDISVMPLVKGIITATGGVTSHAAVLAQKFDVTAVVSCSGLAIENDGDKKRQAKIGDAVIAEGDFISMDGVTGLVFSGICLTDSGDYHP